MDRSAHFLLTFRSSIGLSRAVSEINGDFSRKSQISLVYLTPPLKGFPLELDIAACGQKTRMMGLPGRERSLTISSAVWIQYTNVIDGRTNEHRPTANNALTHSVAR